MPEQRRAGLPDSIVVGTGDGRLLTRSTAVLYGMKMLGGVWRLLAMVCSAIPSVFRDRVYDLVAGVRHQLFARAEEACPTLPAHLRNRFDP